MRARAEGRLRGQPARGRHARGVHGQADPDELAHAARGRGHGGRHQPRRAEGQEPVRARRAVSWLYDRPTDVTERWIAPSSASAHVAEANLAAFRAGWSFGETSELIDVQVTVDADADVEPGTYRNINGTEATALGLIAASRQVAACRCVLRRLPDHARVRPAARALAPRTDWACARSRPRTRSPPRSIALGAAFGGALGVTCTSGPGLDLKTETIGLAVTLELPMIIIDVQRAGPSTGHADQDRAVRPAAGALRAPRRVAAAGDRRRRRARASASRRSTRRCGSRSPTARR